MAIRLNGKDSGPIQFTDDRPGRTIHVGPYVPASATDGDVWIDSDTQNNAGKNILQNLNLATIVGRSVNISINSGYKDSYIVFRGMTLSANADLTVTCNNDLVSYVDSTGTAATQLFKIAGIKASTTTNKFTIKLDDITDSTGYQTGILEGVYKDTANVTKPVFLTGAWLQAQAVSSLQITISAGGFASGSILVYGVN
jgi:hypothetical protein